MSTMTEVDTRKVRAALRETVGSNILDRIVSYVDPVAGLARLRARTMGAVAGQWIGARRDRRGTKNWNPLSGSADADNMFDLPTLRDRSRELVKSNPLALGAINTVVTSVVGTGLSLNAKPNLNILKWTEEQADEWKKSVEAEWNLWCDDALACDASQTQDFYGLQDLACRSALENGDVFATLPMIAVTGRPYNLKVMLIESDRVVNRDHQRDTDTQVGGIKLGKYGEPISYDILRKHPGGFVGGGVPREWDTITALGKDTGRRQVIHLFDKRRVGQSRGVPYLSPVMEQIKKIGTYTDAEIQAAVVSSFFTVFVKTDSGLGLDTGGGESKAAGEDITMGAGQIVDLGPNESIETANPGRPNSAFDPFVLAVLRQIGVALEIPFELLVKHFTASYSASRAALLEAWRFFRKRRAWMAAGFCQPIYESWMEEGVASGRVIAPGFFDEPLLRAAYVGAEWIGDAPGQIDPLKEVDAAVKRIDNNLSNHTIEAMQIHGLDWDPIQRQKAKETKIISTNGTQPSAQKAAEKQAQQDEEERKLVEEALK